MPPLLLAEAMVMLTITPCFLALPVVKRADHAFLVLRLPLSPLLLLLPLSRGSSTLMMTTTTCRSRRAIAASCCAVSWPPPPPPSPAPIAAPSSLAAASAASAAVPPVAGSGAAPATAVATAVRAVHPSRRVTTWLRLGRILGGPSWWASSSFGGTRRGRSLTHHRHPAWDILSCGPATPHAGARSGRHRGSAAHVCVTTSPASR